MSVSRENDKDSNIPQIRYVEFENTGHSQGGGELGSSR